MLKKIIALQMIVSSVTTLSSPQSWAQAKTTEVVIGKALPDITAVQKLTTLSPRAIVSYIEAQGVNVLRFQDPQDKAPQKKGTFSFVKPASQALIEKARIEDGDQGLHLNANDPCCNLKKATIFIEDKAPVMSLIHEYLHELFGQVERNPELRKASVSDETEQASKRVEFFIKKSISGSIDVSNPLWRRDLDNAISEMNAVIPAITNLFSEEALIEGLLLEIFPAGSRHYDEARRNLGLEYAEVSLKNLERRLLSLEHLIFWYKDALSIEDNFEGKSEIEKNLTRYQEEIIPAHRQKMEIVRSWLNDRIAASKDGQ